MTTWVLTALQYLKGRKLRTLLTTLAIVFGVGLIFAFNLVLPSAMDALKNAIESDQESVDLNITSVTTEAFAPAQFIEKVASIEGVEAVTGVLQRQVILPEGFHPSFTEIQLVGVDPVTSGQVHQYDLREGRFLQPEDTEVVVVPSGVAKVGDRFPLLAADGTRSYQVVGVLKEEPFNPDAPRLFITLQDAQAILDQSGLINLIQVSYAEGVNADRLTLDIEKTLGMQFVTNPESDVFATMEIAVAILNLFGMIALFLGGFLIFNTFRTVIIERQHDLGMLRAIGATRRQIMLLILVESLLQGIAGTVVGLVAGYLLALVISDFMVDVWSEFASSIQLELELNPTAFFLAVFMGMMIT
ncbi:MAG: ABC transporter permease, partial [Anaerolineae bacterium]|nr:ABC transporter permease [Anaerolineae bacterium]